MATYRRRNLHALLATTTFLIATALLGACGGERHFDAADFAAALNNAGAEITIGEELISTTPETRVYAADLGAGTATATVRVAPDSDAAREAYLNCEQALDFLCYRAANVVLIVDGSPPSTADLDAAFRSLQSG